MMFVGVKSSVRNIITVAGVVFVCIQMLHVVLRLALRGVYPPRGRMLAKYLKVDSCNMHRFTIPYNLAGK